MRGAGNGGREGASDLRTVVSENLLPTPVVDPQSGNGHARDLGGEVADLLPTPTVAIADGGQTSRSGDRAGEALLGGIAEAAHVDLLPTPTGSNAEGGNGENGRGEKLLPGVSAEMLLPTPRASRGASTTETAYALGGERTDDDRTQGEVVLMPTPVVRDADNARRRTDDDEPASMGSHTGTTLTDAVSLLPTPRATDGPKGAAGVHENSAQRLEDGRATLPEAIQLLPTPNATLNGYDADPEAFEERRLRELANPNRAPGGGIHPPLGMVVRLLPTPLVSDASAPHTNETERGDRPPQVRAIGQMLPAVPADLLPTPNAGAYNENESIETWQARRERLGDPFGMSLGMAVRYLDHDGTEVIVDTTADGEPVRWGKYRPAIKRTEAVTGRLAPSPTRPDGRGGKHRLSSRLVEWMMLLWEGHVTGRGLSRNQELARLGNGVVPIQAAVATSVLIRRLAAARRTS